MSPSQAQVREINRNLLATTRADWTFPPRKQLPVVRPSSEPLSFRERYYGASDLDGDDDDELEEISSSDENQQDLLSAIPALAGKTTPKKKSKRKPKFDSPDSVGAEIERKLHIGKRKRRRAVEEEMQWNEGLCFFMRRQNAWTGAVSREQVRRLESSKDTFLPTTAVEDNTSTFTEIEDSTDAIPKTDNSELPPKEGEEDAEDAVSKKEKAMENPFSAPAPGSLTNTLLPIVKPFLPEAHPVRASLTARSDSELYEKIVRDSRTPAVPINLAHMMRVLVQGWKDEGNWPPKSSVAEMGMMKKGLIGPGHEHKGIFAGHRHLQKGVESVRRVFRLSGSEPPAGD